MTRATRFSAALLAACLLLATSRAAWAETASAKARPIYVLSIWTDDADDQADALTQALRSRVRLAQGWSLLETNQSFETLAIALKCPPKPDATCLQRIGDQLHADHYLWGTLARRRASGAIEAELHYWTRGRPSADATETYSDNLRDPNDESLRAVAALVFANLTGAGAATLVVHAGSAGGAVLVDGLELAQLEGGVTRVDVSAGAHTVGVRIAGFEAPSQNMRAAPGAEQNVIFSLAPVRVLEAPAAVVKLFPVRPVLAYSALVAGAAFFVGSAIEAAAWLDDRNKSQADRLNVPTNVSDVCVDQVSPAAVDACRKGRDALTASTLGWVFAGVGAVLVGGGVYLLVDRRWGQGDGRMEGRRLQPKPKVALDVTPNLGARGASVRVAVTF